MGIYHYTSPSYVYLQHFKGTHLIKIILFTSNSDYWSNHPTMHPSKKKLIASTSFYIYFTYSITHIMFYQDPD